MWDLYGIFVWVPSESNQVYILDIHDIRVTSK